MSFWNTGLRAAVLSAAVVVGMAGGSALAEDTAKKDAKQTGKTVVRGTTAVGKGGSKIFHEGAKGIHKIIGKNATNKTTRDKHLSKAQAHDKHAHTKAAQSEKQMDKAKGSANKVGK